MAKQMIADMKTVTTFSFLDRDRALSLEIRVRPFKKLEIVLALKAETDSMIK